MDPLSGEGARLRGGGFNPPGSFPVLYLCLSRPCAAAEFGHVGSGIVVPSPAEMWSGMGDVGASEGH